MIKLGVPLFPVSDKKASALAARMKAVGCAENEIEETLAKGGGVVLLHRPTGVRIRCCQQRSQALNRFLARRMLVEELEAKRCRKTRSEVKAEEIRRQKGRRERPTIAGKLRQQYALRPGPANDSGAPHARNLDKLLAQLRILQGDRPGLTG
ncbi:MAG: peptide chain release factor-like protein [Verrucomicrobia bacterium]|nr:peptide chain release factor-like protein [Verrucomicrobiota bacterium]